jgi:hypothetical protein
MTGVVPVTGTVGRGQAHTLASGVRPVEQLPGPHQRPGSRLAETPTTDDG